MNERESVIYWSEIEPLCVLRLLARKWWLVVLAALTGAMLASIVVTGLITRTYTSTATFVVTPRMGASFYFVDTTTASDVAEIYSELLGSSAMSQTVSEALNGLNGSISAKQLGETNLIRVSATSQSPRDALRIIQAVEDNYAQLSDYVSSTAVLSVLDAPSVTAIQARVFNEGQVCALAALLGACAAGAALVWLSITSGTVHNSTGAKNNLDARIIASVPHEGSAKQKRSLPGDKGGHWAPLNISSPAVSFPFVESVHRIASKFEHEHAKGSQIFLFSSVSEAEGKSTLAANTALSLAQRQAKVLFIDLDLRRPVQHRFFGVRVGPGQELGALLSGSAGADTVLSAAVPIPDTGLSALLSEQSYSDMIELIASPVLAQTLALARTQFDYIIIDSPPLGYFADSELLSDLSDQSVLVVRQDTVPAPEINDAIDALRAGKAEFLGCILNDMRHLNTRLHAYGYGYGYGYGHGGKYGKYGVYGKYGKYASAKHNKD